MSPGQVAIFRDSENTLYEILKEESRQQEEQSVVTCLKLNSTLEEKKISND